MVTVVYLESLAFHRCEFDSHQGLSIISCEEAIQLAYGSSMVLLSVPARAWNNARPRRGTWGLPVKLESCLSALIMLLRHKTKQDILANLNFVWHNLYIAKCISDYLRYHHYLKIIVCDYIVDTFVFVKIHNKNCNLWKIACYVSI